MNDYHGIVVNVSQKDRSVFLRLNVIGRQRRFLFFVLYKIRVPEEERDSTIKMIQNNMRDRFLLHFKHFYAHLYRNDELVIIYKNAVFHATVDRSTWDTAKSYGKSLGISEAQLDFYPNRFEDETF